MKNFHNIPYISKIIALICFATLFFLNETPFRAFDHPAGKLHWAKEAIGGDLSKQIHGKLAASHITLDNGMEFVLMENHSNPMIASVIVVKTGSKNEGQANNGVSHMLEHLLFNGTTNRTQEQIYDEMDYYGGYNNANTSYDFTNFMILTPREHIDKGLDIQADMLFNSIIPEEKLEKERGIIIEEISKDIDREENIVHSFFNSKLYEGTAYSLPILGTVNTISGISRSQIVSYYKTYYIPNNMVGMLIGDFDTALMIEKLERYFGPYPPGHLPETRRFEFESFNENRLYTAKKDVRRRYLSIAIQAPTMDDTDYFPFTILTQLINQNGYLRPVPALSRDQHVIKSEPTKINREKTDSVDNKASDLGSSTNHIYSEYIVHKDLGTLNIHAELPDDTDINAAIQSIILDLREIPKRLKSSSEDIAGIKTQIKTDEIFLRERMHYYGMSRADLLANMGYQFMESYLNNIERVTLKDLKKAARKYLSIGSTLFSRRTGRSTNITYVATVVEPMPKKKEEGDLMSRADTTPKDLKPSEPAEKSLKATIINKEILPNGLTLITNQNNDSEVFACHVLFKDRAFHEPDGKTGIADFLHRLLLKGTTHSQETGLKKALSSIGAHLTVTDDPYIPYDDYQTSPQFSFIRFETIGDYYKKGLDLLAEIILNPRFDPEMIDKVRKEMIQIINAKDNSASARARVIFYENLFPGMSLSKHFTGTVETISSISKDDLIAFHKKYFSPNNMIINIVSNIPEDTLSQKIKGLFGNMEKNEGLMSPEPMKPSEISDIKVINTTMGKTQSYIYLGYPIPSIKEEDEAPIELLSSIIANDMASRLREEQGLAYSIGCSIQTLYDFGWFQVHLGTRKENIEQARDGIIEIINGYEAREFDKRETEKAINKFKGRMLMRRLPRINQAYYAGIYEFYKDDYDYDKKSLARLNMVGPDDLKRVAERYLQDKNYLLVVIE